MHSFTSSFKPLPHGWRSLILGAVLATLWLAAYEVLWRTRGFVPTLTDNEPLWCRTRAEMATDGVVILGSSRLQTGLDPAILSRELGGRPVTQLALAGSNPIPVLADLAHDTSFRGLVVLEYMPRRLFTADAWSVNRSTSFLAACRNPSLVEPIEAAMGRALQRRLAFLQPDLQPIGIVSYFVHHRRLPGGTQALVRDDRFNPLRFGKTQTDTVANEYWGAPLTEAELKTRATQLHDAIAQIRARGGDVVLYRSPVNGAVLADEEAHFPAATWFPRIAELLDVRTIDFAGVPALRDIACPDGEHPNADQVPSITAAFAAELRARASHN